MSQQNLHIKLWSTIVYSNVWIALGSAALSAQFYELTNTNIDWNVILFSFFATLFTYNFQRILKIRFQINLKGERVHWIQSHKKLNYFILLISGIGSAYFGYFLLKSALEILLISGFISFFYVWKIPFLKHKSLRDVPGIKIYLIAVTWVLISAILPYMHSSDVLFLDAIKIACVEFLFMLSITIPFDVRDILLDDPSKKTIPQVFGEKKAVFISIFLLLFSQLLEWIWFGHALAVLLFTLSSTIVLSFVRSNRKELYFSAIVDGLLLWQWVILCLINEFGTIFSVF